MYRSPQTLEDFLQGHVEIGQNLRQASYGICIRRTSRSIDQETECATYVRNIISMDRCRTKFTEDCEKRQAKNKEKKRKVGEKRREEIFDINVFVARFWCSDIDLDFKSRPGCIRLTFVGPASDLAYQYHGERCIEQKKRDTIGIIPPSRRGAESAR